MASVLTPPQTGTPAGGPPSPPGGGDGFGGGGGRRDDPSQVIQRYKTGVWLFLGALTMVFAGFVSAYVVRRGMANDWRPLAAPAILWVNTVVLLVSSVTMELARRRQGDVATERQGDVAMGRRGDAATERRGDAATQRQGNAGVRWLGATAALGAVFLIGQWAAWQQLRARGVFLASNPSSSFFYLLTGAHGLHLLGGVAALFYVAVRAGAQAGWRGRAAAVEGTSLYWHFMDGLWVFVFILVFAWR